MEKRVIRYINITSQLRIVLEKNDKFMLTGFTDANWAGNRDERKSTTCYVFNLSSGVISRASKKKPSIELSTIEVVYKKSIGATYESLWLQRILSDLKLLQMHTTILHCDNQSSINMTNNPMYHSKMKHVEIHDHYIREKVHNKEIELIYCRPQDQATHIFTKTFNMDKSEIF
jgi:hypothetical protein